jgi:serine/threonine-protein kinase
VANGLTEELTGALAQLPGITVVARTSASSASARSPDIVGVGSRLGSDAVVTGSVRMSGSDLRVIARLVRVADGRQLWAGSYQRDTADLLLVQEEVARDIARGLSGSGSERASAQVAGSTMNSEAHALYLRGLFLWNKRRPEDLWRAISYFRRALEKDPSYGLASARIADAYLLLGSFGYLPLDTALTHAEAAAQRALAIDDRVGAAHGSMGYVNQLRRNWTAAEHEYRRALELNPSDAHAHSQHAFLLLYTGHPDAGRQEIDRAYQLDPVSIGIGANVGWMLYFSGRYPEAIEAFRRVLELDPGAFAMHNGIGRAYEQLGKMSEAVASYREALRLSGGTDQGLATLGNALAQSGRATEATAILRRLASARDVDPYVVAILYAGFNDSDRTFELLRRAVHERSPLITQVTVEPFFRQYRSDARYDALLAELRLGDGRERLIGAR